MMMYFVQLYLLCCCFLFICLFVCFLQQNVYEVKLEDGNVYVKHTSHLSLQPYPADQKS